MSFLFKLIVAVTNQAHVPIIGIDIWEHVGHIFFLFPFCLTSLPRYILGLLPAGELTVVKILVYVANLKVRITRYFSTRMLSPTWALSLFNHFFDRKINVDYHHSICPQFGMWSTSRRRRDDS
jgi:hypothetical protein